MIKRTSRTDTRRKRHYRLRNTLSGTPLRPRLAVFRSNKHIYAQVIDDVVGNTLVAASTLEKDVKSRVEHTSTVDAARVVGEIVAKKALAKGITEVVFDRGGFIYHGKVKSLAEAAREAGLKF